MKKWVAVAAFVLVAGRAVAQEQGRPGDREYLEGEAAFKKGDLDTAIAAFENALAQNGPVASHYYLGLAYQNKGNLEKAGEHYQKYLEKHPEIKDAQYRLAMVLRALKKEDKAAEHFAKVIELDPKIAEPYYFVGQYAYSSRDYENANARLSKFLELKPESPLAEHAHYILGHIAAIKAASMEDPTTQYNLAKTHFQEFLRLKPDSPLAVEAHWMLATTAVKTLQAKEAAAGNQPSDESQSAISELRDSGISHLQSFLELKPDSPQAPDAHRIIGSLAAQKGDNATAKLHFEKFLRLRPEGPEAEEVKKFLADLKKPKG